MQYENLYFSKQVILEYINNLTSNKIIQNIEYNEIFKSIREFNNIINLIDESFYSIEELFTHLLKFKIKGWHVFDLKIYLDMKSNNISKIITANEDDFKIFDDIEIINPFQ